MMHMNTRDNTIAKGIETKIITQVLPNALIFSSTPSAPNALDISFLRCSDAGRHNLP